MISYLWLFHNFDQSTSICILRLQKKEIQPPKFPRNDAPVQLHQLHSPAQSDRQNLTAVLVFSGLLAAPAAVFAEASWYGSLRGGVELEKGQDAEYYDGGSRWGIKGANEISEGLTAVYNFEHEISTADAGQAKGRLAYVGLSGGFGALTLGQVWSASYNHTGVIRDISNWHSAHESSGRVGSALSYAYTGDAFSVQFDAIMAGGKDTGKAVDQWELGATVNIGDIGKVAFAHVRKENVPGEFKMTSRKIVKVTKWTPDNGQFYYSPILWSDAQEDSHAINQADGVDDEGNRKTPTAGKLKDEFDLGEKMTVVVQPMTVYVTKPTEGSPVAGYDAAKNQITLTSDNNIYGHLHGGVDEGVDYTKAYPVYPKSATVCKAAHTNPVLLADKCVKTTVYRAVLKNRETVDAGFTFFPEHVEDETVTETVRKTVYGEKSSHVSASFDVGAVTLGLGHSTTKSMDPTNTMKAKTNYIGASGGIGDTGLSWNAWYRNNKDFKGVKTKPWTIGLKKTLGGGAWAYVEHGNDGKKGKDKSSSTVVGLGVNF